MYVVAIFALALLSPLPFISPFVYDVQNVEAQSQSPPFGPGGTDNPIQSLPSTPTIDQNQFTLTSSSDNTNPSYAKAGDTITVNFATTETLHYNATATIHGRSASVSIFDNILTATITVLETDADGYADFEINVSSDFNNISVSDINRTSGNVVFVDKHVPVITINGPPLVYVTQGDSYTDFGASVTDADPAYSYTPTSNSSDIPTDTIGTYTIEYTSLKDGAGNTPFNKTRTVSVQSSSLTAEASYVDTETILLRFDTAAPAFYSGSNDLASAITVDGQNVKSAIIPGQIRSVTTLDNSIPDLDFLFYGSLFGQSVAHMGDLNQDGYEDILVGIPYYSSLSNKLGAVAILHLGENAQSILDVFLYDGDSPNMPPLAIDNTANIAGIDRGDRFGEFVEHVGDINGDGFADIVVGAPTRDFDAIPHGVVYTLFLGPNGSSILGHAEINFTVENGPAYSANSQFGFGIVNMGDLNKDGINDIAVLAAETEHNDSVVGGVYIMHLGSDGLPIKTIPIDILALESQYPSIVPATDSRTWAIENMGDLNDDGFTDIMLASRYSLDPLTKAVGNNFIYVLHLGENGESVLDFNQISMHDTNMPLPSESQGKVLLSNFGEAIQKLEDLNGDGYTDLLISAPSYEDIDGADTGLLYVVFLGQDGTSALGYYEISGTSINDLDLASKGFEYQPNSRVGTSLSVLGDINSDGALDIVVGTPAFVSIVHDQPFGINGQGALHVLSLAGPDDKAPHVVIKPNATANTDQTSNIVLDPTAGKLHLRSLSTSDVNAQTSDGIAPEIYNITMLTNTSLNIEFSEDIETDTEFGLASFRVSETDQHISVKSVSKTSSNTVLLNVTRISSSDEPLVEIFDSAIKDDRGNVIKYTAQTAENLIGSYPLSAFWGYNDSFTDGTTYYPGPVVLILFEDVVQYTSLNNYAIDIPNDQTYTAYYRDDLLGLAGSTFDRYHGIGYFSFDTLLPFDLGDALEITLAPKEGFLDLQNNSFAKNYTLPIDTFRPPKILSAETSEGRYIILTLDRYVKDVDTSDFSVSDSLSVQNVNISGNKLILDVDIMPTNSTPTVTIIGTITDNAYSSWRDFVHQDVVIGSTITAVDGSNPIILKAEYDNLYNINVTYSEPLDASTINETDFEQYYRIELEITESNIKRITNIETATDGMSSMLTFDKKLNPDGVLRVIGSIYDKTGTAMLYHAVPLSDSTPPTMSSAKTINSTFIEIKFDEYIDATSVYSGLFSVSDSINVLDVTVLGNFDRGVFDDMVLLHTSTIPEDTTPTVTLSGNMQDLAGNVISSHSLVVTDAIAPSLSSLSIISDNDNTLYAKSGDEITLVLVANEPVSYVDGTIFETIPQITGSSNGFNASVTITDTTSNGYSTFTITIVDGAGNTKTITQSDITGTNVMVDTLAPVITLNGSENTTLVLGRTYIDEGTVVIDNDPNYIQTSATTSNNNINNTKLGSYEVTYSTQPDSAGNVPETKARNVTVVELDPITLTSLSIASSSGNNFANAGKTITVTLETDGTDLGDFTGTLLGRSFTHTTSGGGATFSTTVLPGDTNGNAIFSITATNSSGNAIEITNAIITDGSFVTIDTVRPVIILNGNSDDTVLQGNNYVDLGANVSDPNNSSYTQTVTASTTNLDTSSLGEQTITYSAPADAAGNVPDSIPRTVTVQAKPLGLETLTITSDNAKNPSYAKTGDLISVRLVTNGTIDSISARVIGSGNSIPALNFGTTSATLSITLHSTSTTADTDNLEFTIGVRNEDRTAISTFTEADLTGPSLVVDNTAPSIVLVGNNNTVVPTNSSYTDSGAIASDLSYAADITVTGVNNFDINKSGNYTFTYTAPDDEAGNPGPIITRNVIVRDTPPIGINTFTIVSNNDNTSYAKAGDLLYLTLNVNNTIETNNVNVTGTTIDKNEAGTTDKEILVDVLVSDSPIESNATFTITITNPNGTTLTVTKDDLTSSNVFIDTISPRIQLVGPAEYFVINGTENPIIPGVNVTDGDPNYSGNFTLDPNTTVNSYINGSVYNYTYTADADTAGNPGDSMSRIITVIDADPITVTSLSITSSSGNNFANASKTITVTLETDGTDLGNFTGTLLGRSFTNATSGGDATFTTTVSSNDANGNATFSITATNSSGNRITITGDDITDDSFVTIDTIKPVIALVGASFVTILQGNPYSDLGTTITDQDNPSYTGTASATSVDTSSLEIITITYTGPADAAGNVPDSIFRSVAVLAKPLGIVTLTIESNNTKNNLYAKIGDEITITFVANGTIGSATGTIASNTVVSTPTGNTLVEKYIIDSSISDTNSLAFSINVLNEDLRNILTFTQANLSDPSIIIDTTAPIIALNGNNNTVVPTNSSYTDSGAIASDLSYAADIPVTGVNNFNINKSGNYTFTYTAEDEAGNTATITRNVIVKDTPPIGIDSFEIESNNGNKLYAKVGDELLFTLNVNNTINFSNVVANVPGTDVFNTEIGSSDDELYVDARVLDTTVIESNATFTITITNPNGTTLTVTKDDLTTPNVFIDTIPPRIALIDAPANYSIINGTVPIIRNVTVTDGDPNYSGNYTLTTPDGLVNANINGSVYNYTYTADVDTAGNPGPSLTRIITIIDADPIAIEALSIASSPGNPNFANLGKTITVTLVTKDSTNLGNFTGTLLGRDIVKNDVSSGTVEFTETVSLGDADGNVTFSIVMTNSSGNRIHITNININDSSFVTIDTTKPVITLTDPSSNTVFKGDTYLDPSATVSDLNYLSSPTVTALPQSLDTSSVGEKTITYSGPADAAGNVPDVVTRTVTVLAKPLGIDTLTIESSNTNNSSYAKIDDLITITLDANGTINSATTTIASNTAISALTDDELVATYIVDSTFSQGSIGFSIAVSNEDDTVTSTFTQTDLPGSNIIIDTIAPTIALNGNNNTVVPTNSSYTDLGAIASDLSYTSNIPVTGTSNFDITQSSNYTFTYTAEDEAGNTATITRNVIVKDTPPIGIDSFEIESDNADDLYAKVGNELYLTLNVNNTIDFTNVIVDVPGTNVFNIEPGISDDELLVDATILDTTIIESNATFTITIANKNGTILTVTKDDLTTPNVFIDTIPPRIALIDGPADYFIINGTADPIIRNVTVTDGDPNYSGNYTLVTPNGMVDTSINGSVFNYTYTAGADTAGNPGDSLTRIITIIDAKPISITALSIATSTGDPNFANVGKTITVTLETDSTNLGNFTGTLLGRDIVKNDVNSGTVTFTETVLSGDTNENVTFSIEVTNSSGNRIRITNEDITDSSFVTIDTVSPTITLNGKNNTIVALGTSYTDLGATASDLSYATDRQLVGAGKVDHNEKGNYTLVYTDEDAAGNTATIIRNIIVKGAPSIDITLFTIRSSNSDNSYAKAGDTLTIQSSINYTIASYTAEIFGITQSVQNQNSKGFIISEIVPSNLTVEENATFSITIISEDGLPNTLTHDDLKSDNVFVDTISPTVELDPLQISISVNGTIPTITATLTDGDPNYDTSQITIPKSNVSASVDIGTVGTYLFTYTAPDDNAGNPGQSATVSIVVKNETGTTILNSSVIANAPQSFSDEIIKAEIHNEDGDLNYTLSLEAPTVELDVSSITSTSTTTHTTTYSHPLDLIVHDTISARIESGTVLTFTTDSNHTDFIAKYLQNDGHNDDAVQLGLENVRYNLTDDAIAITFERVSSSPTVYLRDNTNDPYVNIMLYPGIVTDGASASAIITATNSIYNSAGALYTHDETTRTVTLWTTHLSTAKENSTSSSRGGDDDSDSNAPTLGKASSGAQLVTNGFEYNGLTVNVGRYHTEFPLIGTNVGDKNTIKMKVYDSAGPAGIKRVEFALGVPDIGLYHEAEAFVEVWMNRDNITVQETVIVDELNLLEDSDVSATVSQTSCSGDAQQCLLVELQYSYREPPAYNTVSIKPVDWDNNAHQFYFNDGIHVDGDSINLPKEITISASHASSTTHAGETLHLVQIDRAEHLWVDQYGYQWKIIGNTVRQITVPEYLVPNDNTYGTLHGPDRNHPEFASSVYAEQQKAQETLAEILGHATIIKPLPENGGTIYFDATGTDSRSGDSFKLLLELETARMQQLSNLLYDDTN